MESEFLPLKCDFVRVAGGVKCSREGCGNFLRVKDDYPIERCHATCRHGNPQARPRRAELLQAYKQRDTYRHPCRYVGEPTGEMATCRSCGGRTKEFPLHACDIYGKCLPWTLEDGYHCCRVCKDYEVLEE